MDCEARASCPMPQEIKDVPVEEMKKSSATSRSQRDGGYLLLAILFMMALMVIA